MNDYRVIVDKQTGEMKKVAKGQTDNPSPAEPLTIPSLDDCAKLSHADLLKLVERMACQCGLVAAMTPVQSAQAVRDRLLAIVLKQSSNGEEKALRDIISAANSWLDRVEGRPKQVIDANVNYSVAALLMQVNDERDKLIEG